MQQHASTCRGSAGGGAAAARSKRPGLLSATQGLGRSVAEMLEYPGMWKYMVMALFLLNLGQVFRCVLHTSSGAGLRSP